MALIFLLIIVPIKSTCLKIRLKTTYPRTTDLVASREKTGRW